MIISCENCEKKFTVVDDLIPLDGRQLKCGSCGHKWFFKKTIIIEKDIKPSLKKKIEVKKINTNEQIPATTDKIISEAEKINLNNLRYSSNANTKISFVNLFFLFLITFVAFIILIDTFKSQINYVMPGFNLFIENFYESIRDFYLFFKDLIS